MPPRPNPLKLNSLQCRTLAILQLLAQSPEHAAPPDETGVIRIVTFPAAHGDHFHIGDRVVLRRDATGLTNPAVFAALERRGLVRDFVPGSAALTPEGLAYETGLLSGIGHPAGH